MMVMGENKGSSWKKVKARDHLEDIAIDEKLILIWIFYYPTNALNI